MHIEIDTKTITPRELDALTALIDVLAGRGPRTEVTVGNITVTGDESFVREQIAPNAQTTSTLASGAASPSPSTAPTVDAGAPDRDSAGLPWDERIHSASKATVADGTWRRRKNTPDETYEAVMAELRGGQVAPDPTPSPSTDDTPPPPSDPVDTAPAADVAASASEDVPPPPPATDGPDLSTFPKFVQAVNGKDVPPESKTYQALNELCATFGVAAFKDMKDRPADWAMFYDMVG